MEQDLQKRQFSAIIFQHLIKASNYQVKIEKGQRIFRPCDRNFLTDSQYDQVKKHELFLSNLPHDLFEDELVPFLCRIGPLYQVRQIMNFSGLTKGMAYVVFTKVEHAYEAVEKLNGEYIRANCNRKVNVTFSVNNTRLLVQGIPNGKSYHEIKTELEQKLSGVVAVKTFMNFYKNNQVNAMVTFDTHQNAASARRLLVPIGSQVKLFGSKLSVEWAKPKDYHTLFVRFNCSFYSQKLVKDFFQSPELNILLGGPMKIKVISVKNNNQYCFVKFDSFHNANLIYKYFNKLSNRLPISCVHEYLKIENISWPIRK